jgi:hypothetical protein
MPAMYRSADFRTVGVPTFNLLEKIEELETLVQPYVTSTQTGIVIAFKGKKRCVPPSGNMHAVLALQFAYRIRAAINANDADAVVPLAFGFTREYLEVENRKTWQSTSIDALAAKFRRREGCAKGGKKSRRWKPEVDKLARQFLAERHFSNEDQAAKHIRTRLLAHKPSYKFSLTTIKDNVFSIA